MKIHLLLETSELVRLRSLVTIAYPLTQ